jgi:hypothetical protein
MAGTTIRGLKKSFRSMEVKNIAKNFRKTWWFILPKQSQ